MHELRLTRRSFLHVGAGLAVGAALAGCGSGGSGGSGSSAATDTGAATEGAGGAASPSGAAARYAMPAEGLEHERTFMAWPALTEVWGDQLFANGGGSIHCSTQQQPKLGAASPQASAS